MKNKLSDSRVLNGLFDLILNLPLGDRRTVGIREYEPLGLPRGPFLTPRFGSSSIVRAQVLHLSFLC